jgi:hypothetical protein
MPIRYHRKLSPIDFFWELVEASTIDDVVELSRDFDRRALELRQIGRHENIREVLTHLETALAANELFNDWSMTAKRAAILEAIRSARQ